MILSDVYGTVAAPVSVPFGSKREAWVPVHQNPAPTPLWKVCR